MKAATEVYRSLQKDCGPVAAGAMVRRCIVYWSEPHTAGEMLLLHDEGLCNLETAVPLSLAGLLVTCVSVRLKRQHRVIYYRSVSSPLKNVLSSTKEVGQVTVLHVDYNWLIID